MNDYVEMLEILTLIKESVLLYKHEPKLVTKCLGVIDSAIAVYQERLDTFEKLEGK